jgi:pimeloyl-ACP methyl ester carboxylesterase
MNAPSSAKFPAPCTERQIKLPDGRELCVGSYGSADGRPVIAFHGTPGSHRMWRAGIVAAHTHGFQLIAADRPAYGGSTAHPGRNLTTAMADLAHVVAAYKLEKFGLLGVSGGTPFACAAAAIYGDRITTLGLVSPLAPVAEADMRSHIRLKDRVLFLYASRYPKALAAASMPVSALMRWFPNPMFQLSRLTSGKADRELLGRSDIAAAIVADGMAAAAAGLDGAIADLVIYGQPWGVDFSRITAPSRLWIGTADTIVPVAAAIALGARIKGCEVTRLAGAGHFWIFGAMPEILAGLRLMART